MEARDGPGVRVDKVKSGGSAAESTYVWKGDVCLSAGSIDLTTATPVQAEAALILMEDKGEALEFKFRRFGHFGCIDWPNGKRTFALPGEPFKAVVHQAGYDGVKFSCSEGRCGTCDMFLRHAETGAVEPVRLCTKSLPLVSPTAGAWELLTKDHPEAVAARKKIEERMMRMKGR
jgi:ferredoxin